MATATRSKGGPLIGKEELDLVPGRVENDYWQQALKELGLVDEFDHPKRIPPARFEEVLARRNEIKAAAKKKGGSRRRRTRRGRKTRSTRRR
jgi:hypothetical protein